MYDIYHRKEYLNANYFKETTHAFSKDVTSCMDKNPKAFDRSQNRNIRKLSMG